jgi:sodium transport system permease protein
MKDSLKRIGVIFRKEVTDNLRDRRSLFSALSSSLIGPALLLVIIVIVGKTVFSDDAENRLTLPVEGAGNAPALIRFLEQNGVVVSSAPADPETAVRNGDLEVVLVIPESYGEDFRAGRPASVRVILDTSRTSSIGSIERVRTLLTAYASQIAALRLLARGVSPLVVEPLAMERVDVATPQSQVLIFLNMMPYFIVLVVFLGGMYVIIDTTAGERERSSLEPLLINPAARWEFVVGKLSASLPFAVFTVFLTLVAFAVGFNLFPLEDFVGFQLTIDLAALAGIFLISLPMILLASALQMIVATFTRSFKEAQTYVAFLPFIPALPGLGLAFLNIKPQVWMMLIPTFGQQVLINQLMRGEPVNPLNILVSTVGTVIGALLLIWMAVKLYERERILFGTK